MKKTLQILALAVLLASLLSGCITLYNSRKVVIDEDARVTIKFESQKASNVFYSKLKHNERFDRTYTETEMIGVFLLTAIQTQVFHETAFYNAQVRRADVNGDGVISEKEADDYERIERKPKGKKKHTQKAPPADAKKSG